MGKIENVRKIKHYVSTTDSRMYGIYECKINGKKEVLVRHGNDVALVCIWLSKPITKSLSIVNDDIARELIEIADRKPKMTNADKIRNMTDEELAEFLKEVKADYQWANPNYPDCEDYTEWFDWLQSEAE